MVSHIFSISSSSSGGYDALEQRSEVLIAGFDHSSDFLLCLRLFPSSHFSLPPSSSLYLSLLISPSLIHIPLFLITSPHHPLLHPPHPSLLFSSLLSTPSSFAKATLVFQSDRLAWSLLLPSRRFCISSPFLHISESRSGDWAVVAARFHPSLSSCFCAETSWTSSHHTSRPILSSDVSFPLQPHLRSP